ncbi:MAG TPA: LamG domain-containing protein [Candidatus Nanopelagicales bacterium]|jgi:hypothetical protein
MSSTRAEPARSGARLVAVAVVLSAAATSAVLLPGAEATSTAAVFSAQAAAAATVTATPACASGTAAYATYLAAMVPAPMLWWRFDTAAGATTVADFAPGGTNKGTARKVAGASTLGLTFGTAGSGVINCDTTFGMLTAGAPSTGFVVLPTRRVSPTTLTLSLWVKLPAGASGRLLGFGNSRNGTSGKQDRALAIDATGHVTFTLNKAAGLPLVLTSTTPVTDGKAHLLVATLAPGASGQAALYVDGALVASSPITPGVLAATYNGYWRAGYDTPKQCPGDLDEVAIWEGAALSPAQVTTLAGSDHWW